MSLRARQLGGPLLLATLLLSRVILAEAAAAAAPGTILRGAAEPLGDSPAGRGLQASCAVTGLNVLAGAAPVWGPHSGTAIEGPTSSAYLSPSAPWAAGTCASSSSTLTVGSSALAVGFLMNFGVIAQPGWVLTVDTCSSSQPTATDTTLFLGSNCPTSWSAFRCFASNGDAACPGSSAAKLSRLVNVTITAATALQYLYAFVTIPASGSPTYGTGTGLRLSWTLIIPPSPSSTPPPSATASMTASPTPSPTTAPYCYAVEAFAASIYGLSGVWNGSMTDPLQQWSIPDTFGATFIGSADDPYYGYQPPPVCSNNEQMVSDDDPYYTYSNYAYGSGSPAAYPLPPAPVVLVGIDLGDQWVPGGLLMVTTCGSSIDTQIWVGDGCPTDANTFDCMAFNDNDWLEGPANCTGSGGSRTLTPVYNELQYVIVSATTNASLPNNGLPVGGNFSITYTYFAPTPTPSGSVSSSGSSSGSGSPTASTSPSSSGSASGSLSQGAAPSESPTWTSTSSGTPPSTKSRTGSGTASHTAPATPTRSVGPSGTGTPAHTVSGTPSASPPALCLGRVNFNAYLNGTSGVFSSSTKVAPWGLSATFAGPALSCTQDGNPSSPLAPSVGPKHVIALDLGVGTPMGGTLTVDTCSNPFIDTQLFVGAGCPTSVASFACLDSDDDYCPRQSLVAYTPPGRWVYIVVAAYLTGAGPYTLSWSYVNPYGSAPFTPTATRTPTATSSHAPGASPSVTPSWSISHSSTDTPAPTASSQPSKSLSPTTSAMAGSCFAASNGIYFTARLTGASGTYSGSLSGQIAIYPFGNCVSTDWTGALDSTYNILFNGPQILFALDLGFVPPPGGTLVVDTCTSTTFDSMLFLGTSCPFPSAFTAFSCALSNDDACNAMSPSNTVSIPQSRVVLPNATLREYFVMLTGYEGAAGTYTVRWAWAPQPSVSTSPTSTPSGSLSMGATPSATPTQTHTSAPTSSATPTPTPTPSNKQNAFHNSSILVMRAGAGIASLSMSPGQALPLFFDEVGTVGAAAGGILQSISLPYSEGSAPCTLAAGYASNWHYDMEGVPSLAYNKQSVVLPCYAANAGDYLDPANTKVVAVLRADGSVDTTSVRLTNVCNGVPNSAYPQAMHTALTNDSTSFLIAGTGGLNINTAGLPQPFHGLFYATPGSSNALAVTGKFNGTAGFADMRYAYWDSRGYIYTANTAADGPNSTGMSILNGGSLGVGVLWHDDAGVPNLYQVRGVCVHARAHACVGVWGEGVCA